MKDAVQSDRAMNRSDSFKRDRRRMIERVNVFIKANPEGDDSDSDEDTAEPESRAGGKSPQTKASAGLTNKDMLMVAQAQSRPSGQTRLVPKTGKQFYGSWKEREQHMVCWIIDSPNEACRH